MAKPIHHQLKHAFIPHPGNDHRPHALRDRPLRVYAIVVLGLKLLVMTLLAFYPGVSYVSNVTVSNIVQLTNSAREDAGLPPLAQNGLLNQAAQSKANDMIAHGYFAHTSPANISPWEWFKRAGYAYRYAGENLAKDFSTSEDLVQAWLASPSHRKNVLNGNYTEIGIAVANGEINGVQTIVVAQLFGAPLRSEVAAATPSESSTQPATQPAAPEPVVEATAPDTPTIATPIADSFVTDGRPIISGLTSPGAEVIVKDGNDAIITTMADSAGKFSGRPEQTLTDGTHRISALARVVNTDLASSASAPVPFILDTSVPVIEHDRSLVLPAWEPRTAYTIAAAVSGDPAKVQAVAGSMNVPLVQSTTGYVGVISLPTAGDPAAGIEVVATDSAGNTARTTLMDIAFFDASVLQPKVTFGPDFLMTVALYSQRFFMGVLLFLAIALLLNVLIRFRVQHQPTVLSTLLLMYTIAVILLI